MTEKLYYDDPYCFEFKANILETKKDKKYWQVVLDQTCFYPEGGGQPADLGWLNQSKVVDVQKKEGKIWHFLQQPLESDVVQGKIDQNHRLDYMQQHSGQHILSGSFMKAGRFPTVSVHLGNQLTAIELDLDHIADETILQVERMANELICRNLPIISHWTDQEGLKNFSLRRPCQVTGKIRIIEIKDTDCVACGGTHLSRTGEVGLVKYISREKIRGRMRLYWKIGRRAYQDYQHKNEIISSLNTFFSAQCPEILDKVHKLNADYQEALRVENQLEKRIAVFLANQLLEQKKTIITDTSQLNIICHLFDRENPKMIRDIMEQIITEKKTAVCLVNQQQNSFNWFIAFNPDLPIRINQALTDLLAVIEGKGGGKKNILQGIGKNSSRINDFFQLFEKKMAEQSLH